uniref:Voltage-dependent T-type calcium channel subunit alpha-1G n=1 Tax=Macrostomum lignano TaxID=282301 RepID=A0A1I8F5R9_9PLAT
LAHARSVYGPRPVPLPIDSKAYSLQIIDNPPLILSMAFSPLQSFAHPSSSLSENVGIGDRTLHCWRGDQRQRQREKASRQPESVLASTLHQPPQLPPPPPPRSVPGRQRPPLRQPLRPAAYAAAAQSRILSSLQGGSGGGGVGVGAAGKLSEAATMGRRGCHPGLRRAHGGRSRCQLHLGEAAVEDPWPPGYPGCYETAWHQPRPTPTPASSRAEDEDEEAEDGGSVGGRNDRYCGVADSLT